MLYSQTFGVIVEGKPLAYINTLLQLSFALNQDNFAKVNNAASGSSWSVEVALK